MNYNIVLSVEVSKKKTWIEALNLIPEEVDMVVNDSRHLQGKEEKGGREKKDHG